MYFKIIISWGKRNIDPEKSKWRPRFGKQYDGEHLFGFTLYKLDITVAIQPKGDK